MQLKAIVDGSAEITDEMANFPMFADMEMTVRFLRGHTMLLLQAILLLQKNLAEVLEASGTKGDAKEKVSVRGIPDFWLTFLEKLEQKAAGPGPLITLFADCDKPLLKSLVGIDVKLRHEPELAFTLRFHFASNSYFNNAHLSKIYFLDTNVQPDAPANYSGAHVYKYEG